jgi:hypothetical protein
VPAKRRVLERQRHPQTISPEALRLWRLCRSIEDERATERWEPQGRRREYLDAEKALTTALGIDWCCDVSPLDSRLKGSMPEYMENLWSGRTWIQALRLRLALIEADAVANREVVTAE